MIRMEQVDICESPQPQLLCGKGKPVGWGGGARLLPHLQIQRNIRSSQVDIGWFSGQKDAESLTTLNNLIKIPNYQQ